MYLGIMISICLSIAALLFTTPIYTLLSYIQLQVPVCPLEVPYR